MARIHLIAIGGAIMHNLALTLQNNGHEVTGSDDIIFDPSRARLEQMGLLPPSFGWFPDKITEEIDLIILGMHAKIDNPELLKAQNLGLKIMSFPEYVGEHAKDKKRVVIAGSHGKTTTSSMIMHVLKKAGMNFDYLVGAQLPGYERMVSLSDAPIMIIEGDEYLSSAIDRRPKFLHYDPHLLVVTGVSWDHINVFKTFEDYKTQFRNLLNSLAKGTHVFMDAKDQALTGISNELKLDVIKYDYLAFPTLEQGVWYQGKRFPVSVFGQHNMKNLKAAFLICTKLGVHPTAFFDYIEDFKGAAKRQQLLIENSTQKVFWDFAHAPSKVEATVKAFREKFKHEKLMVILELHTYSSLNKSFLPHYKDSLAPADKAFIVYNPETLVIKGMEPIDPIYIKESFNALNADIHVDAAKLQAELFQVSKDFEGIVLIMSSGHLGGIKLDEIFINENIKNSVSLVDN